MAVSKGIVVGALLMVAAASAAQSETAETPGRCAAKFARAADLSSYLPVTGEKPVPLTPFFTADGEARSIADFRGKGVVLNFWATWCPPCVKEMPALDRLHGLVAGDGIAVVAVGEDGDDGEKASRFYEKRGIRNLDIFVDRENAFMREAKVTGLPTTLLVDHRGNEVAAVLADAEWDEPGVVRFLRACLSPNDKNRD